MTDLQALLAASIELILDNQAGTGSYVACPDFPPYRYSWFRDGAFIADAMSRVGQVDSADGFHTWCTTVFEDRRSQVEALVARARAGDPVAIDEHLHTRYTLDGLESDEPWWTFQLDGYGTWLWALDAHLRRHQGDRRPHLDAVELTLDYLAAFWDQPCYDWWEEHADKLHVSTLAAVAAGLGACSSWDGLSAAASELAGNTAQRIVERIERDGVRDGRLTKWLGSDSVDASLISVFVPYQLFPPDGRLAAATVAEIERQLAPAGVHRYPDDVYYGGGEWILLAGFLGSYHVAAGDPARAERLLEWMAAHADLVGRLPEQVNTHLLHPEHEQRWIERWGPSAKPLLWSHAMLLTLADDLGIRPAPAPAPPTKLSGMV